MFWRKKLQRRIRYTEAGKNLIAHVEERRGLRWLPTGVREVVDLDIAARAMREHDRRTGNTAGDDDTAGFGRRFKKFARKIAKSKVVKVIKKAHTAPIKALHKITHGKNSPIRKAELALQRFVGKNLPIAKPFIDVHNKLAGATHKVIENATGKKPVKRGLKAGAKALKPGAKDMAALAAAGAAAGGARVATDNMPTAKELAALTEARRRVTAEGISHALKSVPAKQRAAVKNELIRKATAWAAVRKGAVWVSVSPRTGIRYSFSDAQVKAAAARR